MQLSLALFYSISILTRIINTVQEGSTGSTPLADMNPVTTVNILCGSSY